MTEQYPASFDSGPYEAEVKFVRWKAGGKIFGAIAMALGALSGCFGLLTPLTLMYAKRPDAPDAPGRTSVIGGLVVFIALCVSLCWWGGGSLRQKRWVRPIALITSTIILFYGVLSVALFAVASRDIAHETAAEGSPQHLAFWGFFQFIWAFFLVILPAAYLLFFRSQTVTAMLEYYDPVPRWTDSRPILLLGMVAWLALAGGTTLLGIAEGATPFFRDQQHGPAAVALSLVVALFELALARLAYKQNPAAWWGTLVYMLIFGVRAVYSLFHPYVPQINNSSADQHILSIVFQKRSVWISLVMTVPVQLAMFGYLFYVRRYFTGQAEVDLPVPPPADPPQ